MTSVIYIVTNSSEGNIASIFRSDLKSDSCSAVQEIASFYETQAFVTVFAKCAGLWSLPSSYKSLGSFNCFSSLRFYANGVVNRLQSCAMRRRMIRWVPTLRRNHSLHPLGGRKWMQEVPLTSWYVTTEARGVTSHSRNALSFNTQNHKRTADFTVVA